MADGGCGCKATRVCLVCAPADTVGPPLPADVVLHWCPCGCDGAYPALDAATRRHAAAAAPAATLRGLTLVPNFVSAAEEAAMVAAMEEHPWAPSQSGRRKQVWRAGEPWRTCALTCA